MLFYPSAESRTHFKSPPLVAILLSLTYFLLHNLVYSPLEENYQRKRKLVEDILDAALDGEVDAGRLRHDLAMLARENPSFLETDSSLLPSLSPDLHEKYLAWKRIGHPTEELLHAPFPRRILLWITPTDGILLFIALVGLVVLWFVLEHVIHPGLALFFAPLALLGIAWVSKLLPAEYTPDPSQYWSATLLTLILLGYLLAPLGTITFSVKLLPQRPTLAEIRVPTALFLAFILTSFALYGAFWAKTPTPFSLPSLATPLLVAALFLPLLWLLPARRPAERGGGATPDGELAELERLHAAEKGEEAAQRTEQLLSSPLTADQLLRLADLCWQHHLEEQAHRAYGLAFRELTQENRPVQEVLPVFEKLVYRGVPMPGSAMRSFLDKLLEQHRVKTVLGLAPYYIRHPQVAPEQVAGFLDKLCDFLMQGDRTNETGLRELLDFCSEHPLYGPTQQRILDYFSAKVEAQSGAMDSYAIMNRIDHHVDILLLGIEARHCQLQLPKGGTQNVPWSAALGLMGGHVLSPERSYSGCFFLRHNRKVFACHFTPKTTRLVRGEAPMPFADVWALFAQHAPLDIPFMPFDQFKDYFAKEEYLQAVESFLKSPEPWIRQQDEEDP
jgi:hypothetical protein